MTKSNSKSGFTMVEIIAVLVIIGIMAAVAAPKFINMAQEAREKAAVAGISEAKATLSVAYAKSYLQNNGVQPTLSQVHSNAFGSASAIATVTDATTFGDVTLTTAIGTDAITLTTVELDGVSVVVSDDWDLPDTL